MRPSLSCRSRTSSRLQTILFTTRATTSYSRITSPGSSQISSLIPTRWAEDLNTWSTWATIRTNGQVTGWTSSSSRMRAEGRTLWGQDKVQWQSWVNKHFIPVWVDREHYLEALISNFELIFQPNEVFPQRHICPRLPRLPQLKNVH